MITPKTGLGLVLLVAALAVGCALSSVTSAPDERHAFQYDPTSAYRQDVIQGFTVLTNRKVQARRRVDGEVRRELERQLREAAALLPAKHLAALRGVKIWVEWKHICDRGARFHRDANWLRDHGYNPEKAGGIDISNSSDFVNWSRAEQPCMVLHELAHAYHFLVLGENNPEIVAAYRQAASSGLYDQVDYALGGQRRAYALENQDEYFAELSEAYFCKNDYYPFLRTDLEKHDPAGYQLLQQLWQTPVPPAP